MINYNNSEVGMFATGEQISSIIMQASKIVCTTYLSHCKHPPCIALLKKSPNQMKTKKKNPTNKKENQNSINEKLNLKSLLQNIPYF